MWVDWMYYCIAKVQKGRNFVKKRRKKEEETIFNFHFIHWVVLLKESLLHYMRPASSPLMACPDKLQSATSASFFRSLFPTHFTDCFLPRFSQVSFHIMLEILHDWRVNVTPAKTCSTIKRLEKIPKTLIFIAMEKVATLCGGRSDKDRNGNHIWKGEWQSRSQRANVHSYSDHNEAVPVPAPSLQIALDVCKLLFWFQPKPRSYVLTRTMQKHQTPYTRHILWFSQKLPR